jgi:hypothetical protein
LNSTDRDWREEAAMKSLVMALIALPAMAGPAGAAQPLSDAQLDRVAAGSTSLANAAALALGEVTSDTETLTSTNANKVGPTLSRIVVGQAFSTALAAGGFLFDAAAVSHAQTAAKY